MEITQEQFMRYEEIRESGVTNMFDVAYVRELSDGILNKPEIMEIMSNYGELYEKYIGDN